MRTKEVDIEGKKWTISALSVDQVTELVFTKEVVQAATEGKTVAVVEGNQNFVKDKECPVVAAAFNNVIMGDGEWFTKNGWDDSRVQVKDAQAATWWTGAKVSSILDWVEVTTLYAQISSLTGLKANLEKKTSQGEVPAVAEIRAVD